MFWVYLLRCADNSYYTGHTDNLELRISQHHAGECAGYTFTRRPVELAWSQEFVTRQEALAAEMQIKDWSRNKKEAMMRGDWVEVSRLAQSKTPIARPERFVLAQDSSVKGQPDNSYPPRTFSRVRSDPVEGSEHDKPAEASTGSARTDSWLSVQPLLVTSETET